MKSCFKKFIILSLILFLQLIFPKNIFALKEYIIGLEDTEYMPIHSSKKGVTKGYAIDILNEWSDPRKVDS